MNGSMMMMLQKLPTLLMATFKLAGREKFSKVKNAGCRNTYGSLPSLRFSANKTWAKNISNCTLYKLMVRLTFSVDKVMATYVLATNRDRPKC